MSHPLGTLNQLPYEMRQQIVGLLNTQERSALARTSQAMNTEVGLHSTAGTKHALEYGQDRIKFYQKQPSTNILQAVISHHIFIQNTIPEHITENSVHLIDYRAAIRATLLQAYKNIDIRTAHSWTWPVFSEAGPSQERTPLENNLLGHLRTHASAKPPLQNELTQLNIARQAHSDMKALAYTILSQACPSEHHADVFQEAKTLPNGSGAPAMHALVLLTKDPEIYAARLDDTVAAAIQTKSTIGTDILSELRKSATTPAEQIHFSTLIRSLALNVPHGEATEHLFKLWIEDIHDHVLRDEVRASALKMPDGKGVFFLEPILNHNENHLDEHALHADLITAIVAVPEGKGASSLELLAQDEHDPLKRSALRDAARSLPQNKGLHVLLYLAQTAHPTAERQALATIARELSGGHGSDIAFNLAISRLTPRSERPALRDLAHTLAVKLPNGAGAQNLFELSTIQQKKKQHQQLRYDAYKAALQIPEGRGVPILRKLLDSASTDVEKARLFEGLRVRACSMPHGEGAETLLYLLRRIHKGNTGKIDLAQLRADIHEAALQKTRGKSAILITLASHTKDPIEAQRYRADAQNAEHSPERAHSPTRSVHFEKFHV